MLKLIQSSYNVFMKFLIILEVMKGTNFHVVNLWIIVGSAVILFLGYSVLSTIVIRVLGRGFLSKLPLKGILLTFDDGPNPEYTPRLLDLLKEHDVKACFFVVGSKVKQHPDIIKRMVADGHVIGIHHYQHVSSWILAPRQLKKQLVMTEQIIRELTNEQVIFYRPPWGHFNFATLFVSKKYKVMMWSHLFGDWNVEKSKDTLLNGLREVTEDGSVVLLHDCGETLGADVEAPLYMLKNLETFLKESKFKEKKFINLKELRAKSVL